MSLCCAVLCVVLCFDSETIAKQCERFSVSFLGHPFACLPLQVQLVVVVIVVVVVVVVVVVGAAVHAQCMLNQNDSHHFLKRQSSCFKTTVIIVRDRV